MHEFAVWAPKAKRMTLKLGEQLLPMEGPNDHGWWRTVCMEARCGDDYAYLIDDDPTPYPDPRSLWQPYGVHGVSRFYDHRLFPWTDQRWQGPPIFGAVLYELHIGTFTQEGTFDSAIEKLDHLVELGITHVEIMPVAESPGNHGWGYDGVALFAVTNKYGGPDVLKRFVDACHNKGLAVILDVVYNHFGPTGNYTQKFGPYLTEKHKTPWGDSVNFDDTGSDEVRRFFCDNAIMWLLEYHIDGLRLDAVHEFIDKSAVHFMEQLSAEVETVGAMLGRKLVLIAESDLNDPKVVRPREAGGYGMDAQWSDDFHHALFTLLRSEKGGYYDDFGSFSYLAKALKEMFVFDGNYSTYRGRSHGRPIDGLSAHHFISFIQNHDQVGNRATGERLEHLIGLDAAKVALGMVLTAPSIPMLFMGEEFAASTPFLYFADHEDEQMAKLVFEGRKNEFAAFGFREAEQIPDPEKPETFEVSKLNWDEAHQGKHAEMLDWTKKLIHLRRHSLSLNDGDLSHVLIDCHEEERWLTMQRGRMLVVLNLGDKLARVKTPGQYVLALASKPEVAVAPGEVGMPPMSFAVFSAEGRERVS
jgi:maltooligosyltrehalose trehalohydrolase